ncbi:non-ribosomal peptide synthetase [Streptomyces sp. DSM 42041]|uniref:Non-ribosomal peptide synthetase n=1 Tax=Streptomyces hazeniae TaxID=3075538 RepID=A0ABU2P119_9ACTN|nr:non-ribosomal peptide synthetase [Streptomyces sp. DSM 42041]MDT0382163.1 non-ribosomal peptide synthetase [Streptomyces sp. DSM 42041]
MHRYTGNESICIRTRLRAGGSELRRHAAPVWFSAGSADTFAEQLRVTSLALADADVIPDTVAIADVLASAQVACYFGGPAPSETNDGHKIAVQLVREVDEPAAWTLHWYCNDTEISATAFERLVGHFGVLLESALTAPEAPLGELSMLTAAELRQLAEWTSTEAANPEGTVIDLLERCAARLPHASAVVGPWGELSYGELARRVTHLAGQLRTAGVTRGTNVGVLMRRSPGLYIAILAVMKAGGAYVPLDPDHPPQRIATVLDDSSASLLITDGAPGSHLCSGVSLMQVDAGGTAKVPLSGPCTLEGPARDDVAYVIYTSGTTGLPKGIQVPHRALANLLWHFDNEIGLREEDTVGGITTVAFDMSVLELFLPLVRGSRLALLSRETATDGLALRDALTEYSISFMQATPMTWRMLIDADWQGDSRFTAVCGGETTPPDLAEQIRQRVGTAWNCYGPTETTVWSTSHRIQGPASPIPVGRPIANTVLRVLDRNGQLVPIGLPGELYIGGAGVACGYLGKPDLTAQRFLLDRHDTGPHRKFYRTGDIARWTESGELEYLGRTDRQVKVRGYRLELEEIEAVLNLDPRVRHGVVDVRENGSGDQQLVGYIVPVEPGEPELREITARLNRLLPDYMIPRPLMALPEIPLSANGKVLRKQLPSPQETRRPPMVQSYESELEERLAKIWAEVLAVECVLPEDNFFDLGGTSLLAQRVAARVREEFHVRLRMSALLQHPTVPTLAQILKGRARLV